MITALTLVLAYLGIDVAKDKPNVILLLSERTLHRVFPNTPVGFEQLVAWCVFNFSSMVVRCAIWRRMFDLHPKLRILLMFPNRSG